MKTIILLLLSVTLATSAAWTRHPSTIGNLNAGRDEDQLRLTATIVKERYCNDRRFPFLEWTLNLKYTNHGPRPILFDKGSPREKRTLVSRDLRAAALKQYIYAPIPVYADLDAFGYRSTPKPRSFAILKSTESFTLETTTRVPLYDGTNNTINDLHPGTYVLQVKVATWPYYADPKPYREKWMGRGLLWFENVTSEPLTFRIEEKPISIPCSK